MISRIKLTISRDVWTVEIAIDKFAGLRFLIITY